MNEPPNHLQFDRSRSQLPFGGNDLDPQVTIINGPPKRVRCFVQGCKKFLIVPTRSDRGEVCPDHGIRCHCSSRSRATYAYADPRRNIIASPGIFADRIIGHPFKYESHRLGAENSEDTLTWNVFRSLQEAGQLGRFAEMITGTKSSVEPSLFLWGICLTNDEFEPWHLLVAARKRFESSLPVERPLTEPDIALHLPGSYVILIEAKFTSNNMAYESGPRRNASSLTLDELLSIYDDPALQILDREKAGGVGRIFYQLWRNTVFAEWIAQYDHPQTNAFHVNLVREGHDEASAAEFRELIRDGYESRFQRMTWEQVYRLAVEQPGLSRLQQYFELKTARLKKAFRTPMVE